MNEDSHNIIKINFINNLLYYNSEINVEDINWCSNLNVLYKYKFSINIEKNKFYIKEIVFFKYLISKNKIEIELSKVEAVRN